MDEALVWLRRAADGEFAQLLGVHPGRGFQFHFAPEISDDLTRQFEARGGGDPIINPRARIFTKPLFAIQTDRDLASEAELARSPFLHDFAYRLDSMNLLNVQLPAINGTLVCAAVSRTARQCDAGKDRFDLFAALLPHVSAALRLRAALEEQSAGLIAGAMQCMGGCAFVLGQSQAVLSRTVPAEAMLRQQQFVRLRGQHLEALDRRSDRKLQAAIALACSTADAGALRQTRMAIQNAEGDFVIAIVTPLPRWRYDLRAGGVAMIAIETYPGRTTAVELIQELFHLTEAEVAVVGALMDGLSTAEIARLRNAKSETVRGQIKSIMQKTGTDSRVRLMRRLMPFVHSREL